MTTSRLMRVGAFMVMALGVAFADESAQKPVAEKKVRQVFGIGDSIHSGYGASLKEALAPEYDLVTHGGWAKAFPDLVSAKTSVGGPARGVTRFLQEISPKLTAPMDVLLVNAGLHDIKREKGTGKPTETEEGYRRNLQEIVRLGKAHARCLIWVQTTPVFDELHAKAVTQFDRFSKDVERYNEIAMEVMTENKVLVIDLFTFTKGLGGPEMTGDGVHFRDEIRKKQGEFIAAFVKKNVPQ